MEVLSDEDLMWAVRNGDDTCFALLHARHRRFLVRWLGARLKNNSVAEDLAQEVFLRVYNARHRYEPTARFSTWLRHIARNRLLNWIRDHAGELREESWPAERPEFFLRKFADASTNPQQNLLIRSDREQRSHVVQAAIERLPERQRTAVLLHKYHELSYLEVAGRMGCSITTVKSILWRAYEKLRIDLRCYDPACGEKSANAHSAAA